MDIETAVHDYLNNLDFERVLDIPPTAIELLKNICREAYIDGYTMGVEWCKEQMK